MKTLILIIIILLSQSTITTMSRSGPMKINSLKPHGEPTSVRLSFQPLANRNVKLEGNIVGFPWSEAKYTIVIPEHASIVEEKAAYDLAFWLGEITNAIFPVVNENNFNSLMPAFYIGETRRYKEIESRYASIDLGEEGYMIEVWGDDIFIRGGVSRGPIFGVFAFLEEDIGCRWYSFRSSVIPKIPVLEVDIVTRYYVPPLEGREPFNWHSLWPEWAFLNRLNAPQVPFPMIWGGNPRWASRTHNFLVLVPPSKYLKSNPEFYGITENEIESFTRRGSYLSLAHPDVLEIVIESVRSILLENPDANFMMIAQEDDAIPTMDPLSVEFYETVEDNPSALMIHFVNQVAERLENEFPHVIFVTYAYQATVEAPAKVMPRHNVGVRLTNIAHARLPFVSVPDHDIFQRQIREWAAICDHIFIYDYWGNFLHLLAPAPMFEMIAENIRFYVENGVREVSGTHTVNRAKGAGDRDAMRSWVIAKLLWNPDWDLDMLIKDFCYGFYGPAGPYMYKYEMLLRESRDKHMDAMVALGGEVFNRNFPMDVEMFNHGFMSSAWELFEEAINAVADNPDFLERVLLDRLSLAYVKLMQGPEVWGGIYYAELIDEFEETLLTHLANTRFANPWHVGESPTDWRNYWRERLRIYNK